MSRLTKLHLLFLLIAMFIAFALIPLNQIYFTSSSMEEIKQYYQDAFNFKSSKAWGYVFTWFLGLSCGRLMLKALGKK